MTISRLLLLGSTGAVGQAALRQALSNNDILQVVAPTRRPLAAHSKLINPLIDFDRLPALPEAASPELQTVFACDAVICALGTTLKIAGSQAAFAAIDHDLVLTLARLSRAGGARCFALNSSLGASLKGNFYLRTKARTENALITLNFERTVIVRPSLIDADRQGQRRLEQIGLGITRLLRPVIPARYRPVTPDDIARSLLAGVHASAGGVVVVESENIR